MPSTIDLIDGRNITQDALRRLVGKTIPEMAAARIEVDVKGMPMLTLTFPIHAEFAKILFGETP